MWRNRRKFGLVPSAIMLVYGLPGHLEDGEAWLRGFKMMAGQQAYWLWWNYALIGGGVLLATYSLLPERLLRWTGLSGRATRIRDYDLPIRVAIRHVIHTTPHSYQTAQMAADHYFEVLYEQMCSGEIGVVGRRGEDEELKYINKRECKRYTPSMVVVPRSPSAPEGLRYCLVARTRSSTPYPLQEVAFDGFTDLRVRSRDLYRLWPRTNGGNDNA